jgi:hypothetical protein
MTIPAPTLPSNTPPTQPIERNRLNYQLIISVISILIIIVILIWNNYRSDPLSPLVSNNSRCDCNYNFEPVCGIDNKTYANACVATCHNEIIKSYAACAGFELNQNIPPSCTACSPTCIDNDIKYIDENGCPLCDCRLEK